MQEVFRALSDTKRRDILMLLSQQDMTIGDVVDQFDITRAAVKKHLKILEEGNLISVHNRGRERVNRLEPNALQPATEWLTFFNQFWDSHLMQLKQTIEAEEQNKNGEKQ